MRICHSFFLYTGDNPASLTKHEARMLIRPQLPRNEAMVLNHSDMAFLVPASEMLAHETALLKALTEERLINMPPISIIGVRNSIPFSDSLLMQSFRQRLMATPAAPAPPAEWHYDDAAHEAGEPDR